jgi:signal transduction histidine kinase
MRVLRGRHRKRFRPSLNGPGRRFCEDSGAALFTRFSREAVMTDPAVEVLLVQGDHNGIEQTVDVLSKHQLGSRIKVVSGATEALDFLFCLGAYAGRTQDNPRLVLVDSAIATAGGLETLRLIREDSRTARLLVVVVARCESARMAALDLLRAHGLEVPVVAIDTWLRAGRAQAHVQSLARAARDIAREFNNLFAVIDAYTEVLLRDFDIDDPRRDGADQILGSIARASQLTDQLLAFSQDGGPEPDAHRLLLGPPRSAPKRVTRPI